MQELLRRFNGDKHTKEALIEFIHSVIAEEAVEKMYKREDTAHIADAKELIDKAFEALELLYGIKQSQTTQANEAR